MPSVVSNLPSTQNSVLTTTNTASDVNTLKRKRNSVDADLDSTPVKAAKNTPTSSPVSTKSVRRPSLDFKSGKDALDEVKETLMAKERKFLSAAKFAVVGASDDSSKWGHKVMSYLLGKMMDVVPINPHRETVLGKTCLKSIKDLPDPTHTSVSIVVHPKVTLEILKEAKDLNIFCIWLQPGAEDSTVLEFLKESGLEERCIHASQHGHHHHHSEVVSSFLNTLAMKSGSSGSGGESKGPFQVLVGPVCDDVVANPSVVEPPVPVPVPVEGTGEAGSSSGVSPTKGEDDSPDSTSIPTPGSVSKTQAGEAGSDAQGLKLEKASQIMTSAMVDMPCLIRDTATATGSSSMKSRTSSIHEEVPGLA